MKNIFAEIAFILLLSALSIHADVYTLTEKEIAIQRQNCAKYGYSLTLEKDFINRSVKGYCYD